MSGELNYRYWLTSELAARKRRNPAFSLRSFATKLGLSPTSLSLILSGKRRITPRTAVKIADRLNLTPNERESLLRSCLGFPEDASELPEAADHYQTLEVDTFHFISNWYYYAILSLAEVEGSRASPEWIAHRLGITRREAEDAFERLCRTRIIKVRPDGTYAQSSPPLATTDDLSAPAIRAHIFQHLKKAEEALDTGESEEMDFSAITMAIGPEKIALAKREIKKFRRRLCRLLETGRRDRVYAMSIGLYPLEKGNRNER